MSSTLSIPSQLGRYQIREEIGRGMMGVVYLADDPLLGRSVALKTVHLAFAVSDAEKELFLRRFENEARVAALLSHPGIVVVHDVGRDPATDTLFIAFEHLEGRTIAEVTSGGQPLEWRRAVTIAARVAEALHYAHGKGVVHRDVKPANIMLTPSGDPKVMDFGVAKLPSVQLTASGEFLGTPSYMSPEQASAEHVDGRSDVFSLGCVLYLLLTGRRAFDGASATAVLRQLIDAEPPSPSTVRPELPPALDAIVTRSLRKRPEDRYRDARQLADDLEAVREGRPPVWAVPGPDDTMDLRDTDLAAVPPARWSRREALLGMLAVVSVAALSVTMRPPSAPDAFRAELPRTPEPRAVASPAVVRSTPVPAAPPTTVPEPARLGVVLEHPFREARLRVFVDDRLVREVPLAGEPRRKALLFREHYGIYRGSIDVPPGTHLVRLELVADDFRSERTLRARFDSGGGRNVRARVGGAVKRELSVAWES